MRSFLIALQFLTRIKLQKTVEINESNFGPSGLYFPLVGFVIGAVLALVYAVVSSVFQTSSALTIVLVSEIIITGGLHLDGFMDSCDGFFSGREKKRVLEIMKDSRVGSMGVLGLIVLLALKFVFLQEIPTPETIAVLMIMPLLGRLAMIWVIVKYPYARESGLGGFFRQGTASLKIYAVVGYALMLCIIILPFKMLFTVALALASSHFVSFRINKFLEGHTGDTYGAVSELTELFFVFWYALAKCLMDKVPI